MTKPVPFEDALAAAEAALDRLADGLDVPIEGRPPACIVVLAIARQASVVYRALRREASADPLGVSGAILLRSLAEAAVVIRWIEGNPALRVRMYEAEDTRQRLASAEPFRKFRGRRSGGSASEPPVFSATEAASMEALVGDVRGEAIAAGEPIRKQGPVMPSVEIMATTTGDTAMWEAYQIIYRITSPWTHFGGRSISHHRKEIRSGHEYLVVDGGLKGSALRALSAPSMAHLLGSTSRICGLGIEKEARIWQDAVITWPGLIMETVRPQ